MIFRFMKLLPFVALGCKNDIQVDNTNVAPTAMFQTPEDSAVFNSDATVELQGLISDANGLDDINNITWTSSIDGVLQTSPDATVDTQGITRWAGVLAVGTHTLTLTVTDFEGDTAEDAVTIEVQQAAQLPVAEISSPMAFDVFDLASTVDFFGVAYDPNQAPDTLTVTWEIVDQQTGVAVVSTTGPAGSSGASTARLENAQLGSYVATMTVLDNDENEGVATVVFAVVDPDNLDNDGDSWSVAQGDCDDADADVYPNNDEVCDLKDNDCNGVIDDKDADNDLHIDEACVAYSGPLPNDDCNDLSAAIHPAAPELDDGIDNDCNGAIDDGTPSWDSDGDCACIGPVCTGSDNPTCTTVLPGDCNDNDPTLNIDDIDADGFSTCENDCDDNDPLMNPNDHDLDGFSSCAGDCDDSDPSLSPADVDADGFSTCQGDCNDVPLNCGAGCFPNNGTPDDCDGFDQDCDGMIDEDAGVVWYHDADLDGWTSATDLSSACIDPDGAGTEWVGVPTLTDCDDNNPLLNLDDADLDGATTCDGDCDDAVDTTYPGAIELCDGVDNNCVDGIDDSPDADNDGFEVCEGDCDDGADTTYPGAPDAPDQGYTDSNCDGIDGDLLVDTFVDALSGNDSNSGGPNDPYRTLLAAMAGANSGNVLASVDQPYELFGGTFNVTNGVSIYGGYSNQAGWNRTNAKIQIQGGTTAMVAQNISSVTILSQVDIQASSNTATEGNSYGARVLDSNGLQLVNSRIESRSGGPGLGGSSGASGQDGDPGDTGDDGCDGCSSGGFGGIGGVGGGTCAQGGDGGRGSYGGGTAEGGDPGGGIAPGSAGGGGSSNNGNCFFGGCDRGGMGGDGGHATVAGSPGPDGLGGGGAGGVIADQWRGSLGNGGGVGNCGSGGGGGGGGGSDHCCDSDRGGGGGSGGGAGEGGALGTGGGAGGGSFALFLVRSTVLLDGVHLESGTGGSGGAGGNGGDGGSGGVEGAGGGPADDGGPGGDGGDGSPGGRGGHGGGGGGGASYALYKVSSTRNIGAGGLTYAVGSGGPGGSAGGGAAAPIYQGQTGNNGQEF